MLMKRNQRFLGRRCDAWFTAFCLIVMACTAVVSGQDASPTALEAAQGVASGESSAAQVAVPVASSEALRYHRSGNWIWLGRQLLNLLIPAALLFSGVSVKLRDLANKIGRRWFFTVVIYFFLYTLLTFALTLPVSFYVGFVRQHAYGLSNQSLSKWGSDAFLRLMVATTGNCLLMWVPYWLLKRSPQRWWLYTAILTLPCSYFVLLVTPTYIDPLFNDFGPMENRELEKRILALAERSGIQGGRVFQVNKSVDTKRVNAYVTGIGRTQRIVLWDTLLDKLDDDQVEFIMGHEMGHYVLGHTTMLILGGTAVVFFALLFIQRSSGWILRKFGNRIGIHELHDVASVPLMVLLLSLCQLVMAPVMMATSRYNEHEADRFGLELTKKNRAAATSFVELQRHNLSVPRPGWMYVFWRASHPTLGDRIDFCNSYRPWNDGQPLVYGRRFDE